jgi:hypothetical protein
LRCCSRDLDRGSLALARSIDARRADDVKALLIAAILHRHGELQLCAVVANGGGMPQRRAHLARRVLDLLHLPDAPVGIGSEGQPYAPMPHEFALNGIGDLEPSRLHDGPTLLLAQLRVAAPRSLSLVITASLRDAADLALAEPRLFAQKVAQVTIQGGLVKDPASPHGWAPDTSTNNGFDRDAAVALYEYCFAYGVPTATVSRVAVPLLPMQLAKSFALRSTCPIMRYLADAQFLGLVGVWQRLCAGEMPARCDKRWFFSVFCGVDAEHFNPELHGKLGGDADIMRHLNGFVKPYDGLRTGGR